MKKTIFIFGLLAGLCIGVFTVFITWLGDKNPDYGNEVLGYAAMIAAFSFIFVGVRNFRNKYHQGALTFGKALKIGLGITLVASTIYVVIWLIDFYVFMPDFMDKYAAHLVKQVRESGVSQVVMDKKIASINSVKEMYKSPLLVVLLTYLEIVPVGIVISLLTAVLLRRRQRGPAPAAA